MGKGDKRSKKGKIVLGSYGKSRPKNKMKDKAKEEAAKGKAEKQKQEE